jgi:hypothetical protein
VAAIVNVLPSFGQVEVAAWDADSDELVGCERVPVRADVITYAVVMSPLRTGADWHGVWRVTVNRRSVPCRTASATLRS